jgi:hypothetical protein
MLTALLVLRRWASGRAKSLSSAIRESSECNLDFYITYLFPFRILLDAFAFIGNFGVCVLISRTQIFTQGGGGKSATDAL